MKERSTVESRDHGRMLKNDPTKREYICSLNHVNYISLNNKDIIILRT